MAHKTRVKICGIRSVPDVVAAADAGAHYIGFNFFPKSPRYVTPIEANALCLATPEGVAKVALVVNADNDFLDEITDAAPFDMIQLHGAETPERVAEVKSRYGLPVMKVLGVADASDLAAIDVYSDVADQLLLDAKPPKDAVLPGGNGLTFDWTLLAGRKFWTVPWMLAGGLTPDNVAEAIARTGTLQVDAASGVERAPGVKDAAKMQAFCEAAFTI